MAAQRVSRVDRCSRQQRQPRESRLVAQRESLNIDLAGIAEGQAHPPGAAGGHTVQTLPQQRLVAGEPEPRHRAPQPRQVPLQARITPRLATQGFDQLQSGIAVTQEAGLQQAFLPLRRCCGIGDDAAADAHPACPVRRQFQRADGDIQTEIAARRDPAEGPGVQAARLIFEFRNDLHGANFRRAGDRTTGKERQQNVIERDPGHMRRDLRHHLPDGRIILDREQLLDLHAAARRHASQIVAQEVHDHQVLGPVLERFLQALGRLIAGQRSLHRPGEQALAVLFQKQLRGKRDDAARVITEKATVAHRLPGAQPGIQGRRVAEPLKIQREGEIDLIAVAGRNVVADAVDRNSMPFFIDVCGQPAHPCRLPRTLRGQPFLGFRGIHGDSLAKAPEAGEWPVGRRRPVGGRCCRLEQIAQFEVERGDAPQAIRGNCRQRGAQAGEIGDRQAIDRPGKTPSGGFALRRPPIFKKCVERSAYLRFR